ncbi:MAG: hypothetical protein DIU78_023275 [Pseudomonadota bacterium]
MVPILFSMGCGQSGLRASEAPGRVLPLRTVRLYETGVGYFERSGKVSTEGEALPLPTAHIDDALKTLVVLSPGGARVSGVTFESVVSRGLARSLAGLPNDPEQAVGYLQVLESLRGLSVAIETRRGELRGTLVEVREERRGEYPDGEEGEAVRAQEKPRAPRQSPWPSIRLTLLDEAGGVRRLFAEDIEAVRPTDPHAAERLGSAVTALSDRSARVRHHLRVLAQSAEPVRLGYIAETPVWRATYRLLLDPTGNRGRLQGWALVHNDTDETWSNVTVELVNGRPDSFLFPLAAPRYSRRPLAEPADYLSTVPQLAETTADDMWSDFGIEGGVEGGVVGGFGAGHGRLGGSHASEGGGADASTRESDSISIGNLAEIAQASGVEQGALFSYRLAERVDLRAHGSALLPFTDQRLEIVRLTWFDSSDSAGRSAARVRNTTAQTLPSGPVAVYEPSGFAGETALPRLKPGQHGFLRFGVDLDIELELERTEPTERLQSLDFDRGRLREHFVRAHQRRYRFQNRSATSRLVYLVLGVVNNARVAGADSLDYDETTKSPLAVVRVPPKSRHERTVAIEEALERSTRIEKLPLDRLKTLATADFLTPAQRSALTAATTALASAHDLARQKEAAAAEIQRIEADLERMQKHLGALGADGGSSAAAAPLVQRVLSLEDALARARQKAEDAESQRSTFIESASRELAKLTAHEEKTSSESSTPGPGR